MTNSPITLSFDDRSGVANLTFNRPDVLNAINVPMADAFLAAAKTLSRQAGLRCVLMTGAGRAFMAGGDVASMAGTEAHTRDAINGLLVPLNEAILLLRSLDAPIVAGVQGVAAGAGLSLALLADMIVAEENAKFLIAYNGIGAVPDCGGSWFLLHKAGAARATDMMITGRTLTAEQAQDWGLITTMAPADTYPQVLAETVAQVAKGPTRAFGAFRQLLEQAGGRSLAAQLEAEHQAFLSAARTDDFKEGVSAFIAKRPAAFQGQ